MSPKKLFGESREEAYLDRPKNIAKSLKFYVMHKSVVRKLNDRKKTKRTRSSKTPSLLKRFYRR